MKLYVICSVVLMWCAYIEGFVNTPFKKLPVAGKQFMTLKGPSKLPGTEPKSDPLNVMLVVEPTPFNYVSGYSNRFKEMLKGLKNVGSKVHILTPDADPKRPIEFEGFPITSVHGFKCPMYNDVRLSFDFRFKIGEIMRKFKPDIVHVSCPSVLVLGAILWTKLFKIPLVMSYHTDMINYVENYLPYIGVKWFTTWYTKFTLQFADLILCTSPQLKDRMASMGVRRLDVWQKGINTEIYSPKYKSSKMRNRLTDGNPKDPLLLYVGRLGYEKKIDKLKQVLDSNPGVRLALVGTGPAEQYLKDYFKGYPVHFTGQLKGEELSEAFASVDLFTMPSDTETLGFVVMESMASGIPVVGVTAGGLVDIIQDGVTGYLASNDDNMKEFSDAVKKLVKDKAMRKSFAESALKWTKDWSWDAATTKLANVQYRKAIELFEAKQKNDGHLVAEENRILEQE